MTRLAYILALLLLSAAAAGQRAPVSVSAALTPPCSPSLSGVGARLIVSLHVNDATVVELPVRLHVRLEGAGVTIESVPSPSSPPLLLGGGEARVLTGDDLAPYLRLDNLSFRGLTKAAYRRGGHLPGGLWRLSVSVRHLHTGRPVSNVGAATAWLAVHGPPSLSSPLDGSAAPPDASSPLTFSWRACKLAGGAGPVMYRLEVWSLRSPGVPAQAVAASTPPLYSAETSGLSASVPAGALALEPGMRYCWRVTAYDPSGAASFENGGATEVRTFRYLEECPAARGLAAGPVDGRLAWEGDRAHTGGYDLELRSDDGAYHATLWSGEPRSAPVGGPPGRVWRARVRGVCRGRAEGAWSDWVQFAAPAAPAAPGRDGGAGRACGAEPPPRAVAATAPAGAVQEGDTLEDARGATRYVVRSASRNDDGSFRGLSYMLLRPWGVGALGEYDDMRVNSDGVILGRFSWRASRAGAGVVSPADVERWASEAALGIAGAAYSNAIRDTVDLSLCPGDVRFETIRRDGAGYFAVTRDGGEVDITPMVGGRARALVRDAEGHELVIDKDGEPMGVEEYRSCGGSAALLRESARSKDALVAGRGNVVFSAGGGARLDAYGAYAGHAAAAGYARRFPAVGAGAYRPAYACAGSGGEVLLTAEPHEGHTFRTGRGVPVPCRGGALSVTARGDRDTVSVYAYDAAGAVVGKVSVLSFDRVTRKVCLVPVGDARAPDAGAAKRGLDRIFAGLMVDFDVSVSDRVDIAYENGRRFTHGGSGAVGVYNADQRAAIAEVRSRGVDRETCYLFLVECGTGDQLDGLGRVRPVAGYMPRGFQFGFIYNQYDNWRAMAHELCHGAFHLAHTFAADDFLAPERSTDNLMDYGGGEALNHWQWAGLHRPGGVRFKWLQDEEGAEAWGQGTRYKCICAHIAQKIKEKYRYFYYPNGSVVDMKDHLPSGFYLSNDADAKMSHGAVATIRDGNRDLYYIYDRNTHNNKGYGYALGGKAVLQCAIPQVDNPNLEELNPVRVYIDSSRVTTVDFHGDEMVVDNATCECNMAKFKELTADMLVSEADESLSKAPRLFYDPRTNEIIFVTKVHDLKWFRVAPNGPKHDLDSWVAQGAEYHYYTEAELADTKYNQLRTDVQNAMKEGGKVVMIGLAATVAAPYLIEYSAVYGEQVLARVAQRVGEKAFQELMRRASSHYIRKDAEAFFKGAVSQFFVSSFVWAAEESAKGNAVTTEKYMRLMGAGFGVDVFNMNYGNETRDFWWTVLQAGVINVIDENRHLNKNYFVEWVLTALEDFDYSRIISAFYDSKYDAKQAVCIVICDVIRKIVQSAIDVGGKRVAQSLKIGDLDVHAKELLFLTMYDSISRLISNSVASGMKLNVIDYDMNKGWLIFDAE